MPHKKLILAGWDGADWAIAKPLMERGKMPQLEELVNNGASGPLKSLPPYLSPMLWNIIATGKHPAEHGIIGFTEYNAVSKKIQPISSQSRRVKAIWNMLSQSDRRAHVFGWFASHPAESVNGVCVAETFAKFGKQTLDTTGNWPPMPPVARGSVTPAEEMERLARVRIRPQEIDVNILQFFIPKIREVDLKRDKRPDQLLVRLSELYTLHNAAVDTVQNDPDFHFLAIYYHFIDWICHDFMEYGAPQRPEISDRDFELYSGVVEKAYELQDLLLRDLLTHAGPDTACLVCSDHGFLSGDERPKRTPGVTAGIAAWHRPHGIVAFAGSGIERGVHLDGAQLADITPTLLHYFELPVGEDMMGKVLTPAFSDVNDRPVRKTASWERCGPALDTFRTAELTANESAELLQQFADLGYVDLKGDPFETSEQITRRENAWNLGQALLHANRLEEALPHLEEAYFHNPEQPYLAYPLARCQARLGLREEAHQTAATLRDFDVENREACLYLAELYRLTGDYEEALQHLDQTVPDESLDHRLHLEKGLCLLYLNRFAEAEVVFREQFEKTGSAEARLGLARARVRSGNGQAAEPLILEFVEEHPSDPIGWFTLAQVYEANQEATKARDAFKKAVEIEPAFENARMGQFRMQQSQSEKEGSPPPILFFDGDFSAPDAPLENARRAQQEFLNRLRHGIAERAEKRLAEREANRAGAEPMAVLRSATTIPPAPDQKPIIVVSGLPRSGTSLMMQMLQSGGLPLKTDGKRHADAHNEKGYFEWDKIKSLQDHPEIVDEAAGMAVKIVSLQLGHLPRGRTYWIIWMQRPLEEIVRSQEKMILAENPGRTLPPLQKRISLLRKHRDEALHSIRAYASNPETQMRLLEVAFHDAIARPETVVRYLTGFLGDRLPQVGNISATVDPRLHHEQC